MYGSEDRYSGVVLFFEGNVDVVVIRLQWVHFVQDDMVVHGSVWHVLAVLQVSHDFRLFHMCHNHLLWSIDRFRMNDGLLMNLESIIMADSPTDALWSSPQ